MQSGYLAETRLSEKAKRIQNTERVNKFEVINYIVGCSRPFGSPAHQILHGVSLTIHDILLLLDVCLGYFVA